MLKRFREDMSFEGAILAITGCNPGSIEIINQIIKTIPKIDPHFLNPADAWKTVLRSIDAAGLHDGKLSLLYGTVCAQDIEKTAAIAVYGSQFIGEDKLLAVIEGANRTGTTNFDLIEDWVREIQNNVAGFKKIIFSIPQSKPRDLTAKREP